MNILCVCVRQEDDVPYHAPILICPPFFLLPSYLQVLPDLSLSATLSFLALSLCLIVLCYSAFYRDNKTASRRHTPSIVTGHGHNVGIKQWRGVLFLKKNCVFEKHKAFFPMTNKMDHRSSVFYPGEIGLVLFVTINHADWSVFVGSDGWPETTWFYSNSNSGEPRRRLKTGNGPEQVVRI